MHPTILNVSNTWSLLIYIVLAIIITLDHIAAFLNIKPNCTIQLISQFIIGGLKNIKDTPQPESIQSLIEQLEPEIEKFVENLIDKQNKPAELEK